MLGGCQSNYLYACDVPFETLLLSASTACHDPCMKMWQHHLVGGFHACFLAIGIRHLTVLRVTGETTNHLFFAHEHGSELDEPLNVWFTVSCNPVNMLENQQFVGKMDMSECLSHTPMAPGVCFFSPRSKHLAWCRHK